MSERLDENALSSLEKAYRDRKPTYPCPVCKQTDWTLGAAGMGRETWVCRSAQDARPIDWDHYGASSREVMSGDPDVLALIAEVRERRAADLDSDEHTVLGWIRGLAMTWNGVDADKGRAVINRLHASSFANLTAHGVKP